MSTPTQQLDEIEHALESGTYRPGPWQRLIREVEALPIEERRELSERVSAVSDKLHARNGFPQVGFLSAYLVEWGLLVVGILLATAATESGFFAFVGVVALLLCMQPLVKVTCGLLSGVGYSYAYLWYVEPRFKMRYGTYLEQSRGERVVLNLAGSIGTPLALALGWLLVSPQHTFVVTFCAWLFWAMVLLQVATFIAEWIGITHVGPFRLSLLTSPATAAAELRRSD